MTYRRWTTTTCAAVTDVHKKFGEASAILR